MVPLELKQGVERKIDNLITLTKTIYGVDMERPTVSFKTIGSAAGRAWYARNEMELNDVLLTENGAKFIERTVVHEFAHLLDYLLHPDEFYQLAGQKRSVHGDRWKSIMRNLGCEGSRHHSYDLSTIRLRSNRQQFWWECTICAKGCFLGAVRHKKMVESWSVFYSNKKCRCAVSYVHKVDGKVVVTKAPGSLARLAAISTITVSAKVANKIASTISAEDTYTAAGISKVKGVLKIRLTNSSPEARTKVLAKGGQTEIQFFRLHRPMTAAEAIREVGVRFENVPGIKEAIKSAS